MSRWAWFGLILFLLVMGGWVWFTRQVFYEWLPEEAAAAIGFTFLGCGVGCVLGIIGGRRAAWREIDAMLAERGERPLMKDITPKPTLHQLYGHRQ